MSLQPRWLFTVLTASGIALLAPSAGGQQVREPSHRVDPHINAQFSDPNVQEFVKRFETESREIYARREAVVAAVGLKPGMAVGDVGAGTGLFTRLFADQVGPQGAVYAVDISEPFLRYIAEGARARNQPQIKTVRGAQNRTNLPPGSVDVVFICDVFHHVEQPKPWLATISTALRPGGRVVLIEFDRARAAADSFVKKHVRDNKETLIGEFVTAGFEPIPTASSPPLKENFYQAFRKPSAPPAKAKF